MADITENTQNPVWSNGIYQIETSDPVLGGVNGILPIGKPKNWQHEHNG